MTEISRKEMLNNINIVDQVTGKKTSLADLDCKMSNMELNKLHCYLSEHKKLGTLEFAR